MMGKPVTLFLFWILWVISFEASAARASTRRCPPIEGDNLKVRIKSRGRVAKFKCRKGYTMFEGDRFATCVRGQWNGKIPKCITSGCEYYNVIEHGEALYLYNDALVHFVCMPGYTLEGSQALTCDGDTWNGTKPVCQAPSNVALSCDFEDPDLCGWTNGDADHFDWMRNQGPATTFDAGTGPKTDHSLGTEQGHYMYIAAAIPRESGDKARLFSPVYSATVTDTPACFAFYYHMFGSNTGNLNVYVKGESEDIEFLPPVYEMSSSDTEKWVLHVLHLNRRVSNFQIVLEGVQGAGYNTDMAIDDVQLAQGDDCDRLDQEFQNQYNNPLPGTTKATTNAPTTGTHPTTDNPDHVTGTSGQSASLLTTTQTPGITSNKTLTSTKAPSPLESTPGSITTSVSVKVLNQTTTLRTTSAVPATASHESEEDEDEHEENPDHESDQDDEQEHEDLNSCKNRCGEIAVESNTCGCDIVCNNSKTCCPDIQKHCPGYFTTPPPVTLSSRNVTVSLTTLPMPTQKSTTKQPSASTKSGGDDSKSTGSAVSTVSTSKEISKSTTKAVTNIAGTTKIVTTSTAKPQSSETPKSTVKPTTKSTSDVTLGTTVSESVTTPKVPPKESSTAATIATTIRPKRPDDKTTTTKEKTTVLPLTTVAGKPETAKTTPASVGPEKTTKMTSPDKPDKISESTAAPSTGSERSAGLSQSAVFTIAIGTTTAIILLVILAVAYIRKRRQDKLPEDSDIRFLARDEVMMEGNVFNLSGTISHVRNTAI